MRVAKPINKIEESKPVWHTLGQIEFSGNTNWNKSNSLKNGAVRFIPVFFFSLSLLVHHFLGHILCEYSIVWRKRNDTFVCVRMIRVFISLSLICTCQFTVTHSQLLKRKNSSQFYYRHAVGCYKSFHHKAFSSFLLKFHSFKWSPRTCTTHNSFSLSWSVAIAMERKIQSKPFTFHFTNELMKQNATVTNE